ncbi:MAG: hypothetical protein ATN35_01630 [Epulopiscium sp. Nele67-Bin004]|nr:MAG: hypothetical protein ATN35_01630 [Epulopiscium sp. Nele67-Bin004]
MERPDLNGAIQQGNLNLVKQSLEELELNINDSINDEGDTALILATQYNKSNIVKYLVQERGAEIDIKNTNGKTALDYASEAHYAEIIKLLKKYK